MLIVFGSGAVAISGRNPGAGVAASAVLKLACLIAAVRIAALWIGLAGIQRGDWLQIPAQFLLMLGWPDIYLARAARAQPVRWALICTLILAGTSFIWSMVLLWFANRIARKA
ncbi:MAG TPA: hypothetical protein VE783_00755 [Candidatus Limnocylindrales bacterium]|nr:hypothetical protein [Candidatus Limnocylindrales bacterium]